jgi:site-specific DNA-cytosine methylase
MKLLELFSGTKSVSKAVGHLYDEIVSVDILDKNKPTIVSDILTWDYKVYPPNYFHSIWASPPCTEYSRAKTTGIRNLELADKIVKRTIQIIEYFNPEKWFMENPQTGMLKDREFMLGIPFHDVDYCRYSDWGYRKRTRIWTLNETFIPKICNKACGNMIGTTKHKRNSDNGNAGENGEIRGTNRSERYRIPEALIKELFQD